MSMPVLQQLCPHRALATCLVLAAALGGRPARATPTNPCEEYSAAREKAPKAESKDLHTRCREFLDNEAKFLKGETSRLQSHVNAGKPVRLDDTPNAAGSGATGAKPAPTPSKSSQPTTKSGAAVSSPPAQDSTLPKRPEQPTVVRQPSKSDVVSFGTLKDDIRRAVKAVESARSFCETSSESAPHSSSAEAAKAPCAKVIEAERDLLAVSAVAIQATYWQCTQQNPCPSDESRAALVAEVGLLLAADAVKGARELGLTSDVILDLLALAARGEKELTELSLAADRAALNNQAPRDVVDQAKGAIERARKGEASLWRALAALPREEQTRVALLLQSLANPGSRHVPEARLRLAVLRSKPSNEGSPIYRAETDFLNGVKEVLVATTDMALRSEDAIGSPDDIAEVVRQCQDQTTKGRTQQACDGVLELEYQASGENLKAIGRIHLPARAGGQVAKTKEESVDVPVGQPASSSDCSRDPRQARAAAAYALLRGLSSSYAVLNELPFLGYFRSETTLVQRTCMSGDVKTFEPPLEKRSPKPSPGFVFENKGCPADFNEALRSRLDHLPFFRDLTGQKRTGDDAKAKPALVSGGLVTANVSHPSELEARKMPANCEVSLRDDAQTPPYYAIRSYWRENGGEAGNITGAQIAEIVTAYQARRIEDWQPPPVPPDPQVTWSNAFWAFASPGLPWLVDGVDSWNTAGVAASASDAVLLMGAAAAYGLAAEYRYRLSTDPNNSSLAHDSQTARDVGAGLLISAGALRLVALGGYLWWSSSYNRQRSLANALTQPLTWSF